MRKILYSTENAETKGDTTNFQTATIEGKAYPVEVDGKMSIGKKLVFDSEAKAKAWLNKQAKEVFGMTLRKFYLIYNEYLDFNGLKKKDEELNLDSFF